MSDDIDKIRDELDEVRKLKEELRKEVEEVRRQKEKIERREEEEHRSSRSGRRVIRPRPPPLVREPDIDINLSKITDSLEDMMDGLGHQIEMSIKDVEGVRFPGIRIHKGSRRRSKGDERRKKIEAIPPERVAKVISPLGSEERLKILDFLKTGGKSFNELEEHTGKTGSSLTHHLNPLLDAGYVVKGEVRGTYYATVEGRLAYRLSQWLTNRVERQRERGGNNGLEAEGEEVKVEVEPDDEDSADNYDIPKIEDADLEDADDLDDLDWKD